MNKNLTEQARDLTARSYSIQVRREEPANGQAIFLLSHPELPGCMALGLTMEEAQANLYDARLEYILSLLEGGLPVPEPVSLATITGAAGPATPITGTYIFAVGAKGDL